MDSLMPKMIKIEVLLTFQTVIVAKLTPRWFILILWTKTYLLVPKPSLYDLTLEIYDQNQANKRVSRRPKMTKIEVFGCFWAVILAKLATKWFILILFTKTYLLVPKPSLYDLAVEIYDQNQAKIYDVKARPEVVFEILTTKGSLKMNFVCFYVVLLSETNILHTSTFLSEIITKRYVSFSDD